MIELTQKDREKLAQAPIGRLALKRIEELEAELAIRSAQLELYRSGWLPRTQPARDQLQGWPSR